MAGLLSEAQKEREIGHPQGGSLYLTHLFDLTASLALDLVDMEEFVLGGVDPDLHLHLGGKISQNHLLGSTENQGRDKIPEEGDSPVALLSRGLLS